MNNPIRLQDENNSRKFNRSYMYKIITPLVSHTIREKVNRRHFTYFKFLYKTDYLENKIKEQLEKEL